MGPGVGGSGWAGWTAQASEHPPGSRTFWPWLEPSSAVVGCIKGWLTGQNPGSLRWPFLQEALPDCSHLPPAPSQCVPAHRGGSDPSWGPAIGPGAASPAWGDLPDLGPGHQPCLGELTRPGARTPAPPWRLCKRATTSRSPAASACGRCRRRSWEGLLTSNLAATRTSQPRRPSCLLPPKHTEPHVSTLVPTALGTRRRTFPPPQLPNVKCVHQKSMGVCPRGRGGELVELPGRPWRRGSGLGALVALTMSRALRPS